MVIQASQPLARVGLHQRGQVVLGAHQQAALSAGSTYVGPIDGGACLGQYFFLLLIASSMHV